MDDLISRKALLEELDKWINPCVNYDKSEFLSGIATAISEVETAPTVDAAPVVHGRWDDSGRFKFFDCDIAVRCSMCGGCLTEKEYAESVWNFFPVCGAKMDGGNDDENFSSLRRIAGGDD